MSLVTLGDQAKALALIEPGISARREALLLSLAGQTSWTNGQRELLERMWNERTQRKEATMKTHMVFAVVAAVALVGLSGCATTYEKRFTDHEGRTIVIREHHDADWWNIPGTPDWVNVRHETILRDGTIITERHCRHEAATSQILDCTGK